MTGVKEEEQAPGWSWSLRNHGESLYGTPWKNHRNNDTPGMRGEVFCTVFLRVKLNQEAS